MKQFLLIFIDQFKSISQYNEGSENPAYLFMFLLAVIGFFSLAMIIDRFVILWKSRINFNGFVKPLLKELQSGNREKAFNRIKRRKGEGSPFAEIIFRGCYSEFYEKHLGKNYKDSVHEAKLEIFPKLKRRTKFITLLQNIATLIGLAGTIFGLIISFDAVGGESAADASRMLASGISAAMGTTIAGLLVAIPALTFGVVINYKVDYLIKRIDIFTFKIQKLINN